MQKSTKYNIYMISDMMQCDMIEFHFCGTVPPTYNPSPYKPKLRDILLNTSPKTLQECQVMKNK